MLMEEVSVNIEFGELFELFVVNHPSFNDKAQILWSSLAEVSLSHDFFFDIIYKMCGQINGNMLVWSLLAQKDFLLFTASHKYRV